MDNKNLIGKRIKLISMVNEQHPVESGTEGTITSVGFDVISVQWDNGRRLGVIIGEDRYQILE
jgi:hypothetical protein